MTMVLRGHHLLCVHGFQGMGYSPTFVEKMQEIVDQIRNDQIDFPIRVIAALDSACQACPHKGTTTCEASDTADEHVMTLDQNVITHLGLEVGNIYSKSTLVELTATRVSPTDLDHLCKGCSWLPYGVCKKGITSLQEKLNTQKEMAPSLKDLK